MKIEVDLFYTNLNVLCKRLLIRSKISRLSFFRLTRANFASVNTALHYQTLEQREGSQTSCSNSNFLNASLEKPRLSTEFFNDTGLESGVGYAMSAAAPRIALEILHSATSV